SRSASRTRQLLCDREDVSFSVDRRGDADAFVWTGLGTLLDLSSRGHHSFARRVEVVYVKPETGIAVCRAATVMKRDRCAVLDKLGPFGRLVSAWLEAQRPFVEGRAANDVRGHQHEVRFRDPQRVTPFNSGSDCRSVLSSKTFPVMMSGRIRFTSPVSTFPGPNSINADAPSACARLTEATHCTGDHTCFSSNEGISRACSCTRASTLAIRRWRRALNGVTSIASRNRGAAACIAGEWNAAETRRGMTRFAPMFFRSSAARASSARGPDTTTCPGALSFATTTCVPMSARATAYASSPMTAAMA